MPTRFRCLAKVLGGSVLALTSFLLIPATMEAQGHGVSIFKSCVSPKQSCGSNLDCSDPLACDGLGICTSDSTNHTTECTITLTNSDPSLDSIKVFSASDNITSFSGPITINNLPISGTTGTVSGDCTGTLDPLVGCTLTAGASISFLSNTYVIQSADPSPLLDRGDVVVQDLCNVNPVSCSMSPVTASFGASTILVSGCTPGLPCTPTPTNTPD